MAITADLKDFRGDGPPSDTGTFQIPATAIVFQLTFSGTTTVVAMRVGVSGWVLIDQGTVVATVINAALTLVGGADDGEVVVLAGAYAVLATLNVPESVLFRGVGWGTIFNYNAGGNCITITGDNVKIRDLKIDIVAGAGAGGTRPNCILADTRDNVEITKVWLIGDETVGDDGSDVRQCGIVLDVVTFSRVSLCRFDDHMRHGIILGTSSDNTVTGNTCQGNTQHGINLFNSDNNTLTGNTCSGNALRGINIDTSSYNTVTGNTCQGNTQHGILLDNGDDNTVTGNTCNGNTIHGISVTDGSNNNTVTGNTCNGNTQYGLNLAGNSGNTFTGNTFNGNTQYGIVAFSVTDSTFTGNTCSGNTLNGIFLISSSDNNTLTGNTCSGNTWHGIQLDDSSNNTLVGNSCNENDSGNTGSFDGINITDVSLDNIVHSNTCNDNDRYGINIDDVQSLRNSVKFNKLRGNTSGPFNDDIANLTELTTVPIPLIQGTTFISTALEAWGWEIDAAAEFALGIGWLPLGVQQVVRIRTIGVGLAAPGAGNAMRIEITGEGATFGEDFATEPIDVANHPSEETNFNIDEVIQWVIDATDDANIGNLLGGDRLQLKLLHEIAGNGDIATDAIVDSIQCEVV